MGGAVGLGTLMHIIWALTHIHTKAGRQAGLPQRGLAKQKWEVMSHIWTPTTFLVKGRGGGTPSSEVWQLSRAFKTLVSGVKYQPGQIHCGRDGRLILPKKVCSYCLSDPMVVPVCLKMGLMGWKEALTWLGIPVCCYRGLVLARRQFVRL